MFCLSNNWGKPLFRNYNKFYQTQNLPKNFLNTRPQNYSIKNILRHFWPDQLKIMYLIFQFKKTYLKAKKLFCGFVLEIS